MAYCTSCGARLTGTPFCGNCGAATPAGIASTPIPPPPQSGDGKAGAILGWAAAAVVVVAAAVAVWWLLPNDEGAVPAAEVTASTPSSTPTSSPTPSPTASARSGPTASPSSASADWVETFSSVQSGVARIEVELCDGTLFGGSGFLIDDDRIVTAAHVVAGVAEIDVSVAGESAGAQVLGIDQAHDLALLDLDTGVSGHQFQFDTDPLAIGEEVAAAGYPLTGELSLTRGAVTAVDLAVPVQTGEVAGVVRTDAAVNPGNSGGALIREDGAVAGVVFAKWAATDVEGIGYALSAEIAAPKVRAWTQANQVVDTSCRGVEAAPPDTDFGQGGDPPPGGSFGLPPVPSWVVVLESLDVDQFSYDEALERSLDYDFTLGVVTDVFLSDDYGSLNPGYWVVAVSAFAVEDDAAAYCRSIQDVVENCYQRLVDY